MAVRTQSKVILGKNVSVTQWPATKAIEMQVKLMNCLKGFTFDLLELEDDAEVIRMIKVAMATVDSDFFPVVKEFVLAAAIEGRTISPSSLDMEYSGDLTRLFLTFAFVAKVNFQDFF